MRRALLALSACGLLIGCATPTTQLPPPMPITQPPSECLTDCPPLPLLTDADEASVVIWLHDLIGAAGACRRQHQACRGAALRSPASN